MNNEPNIEEIPGSRPVMTTCKHGLSLCWFCGEPTDLRKTILSMVLRWNKTIGLEFKEESRSLSDLLFGIEGICNAAITEVRASDAQTIARLTKERDEAKEEREELVDHWSALYYKVKAERDAAIARAEKADRFREILSAKHRTLRDTFNELVQEVISLRAKLAEAEKDTKRLDWMEERKVVFECTSDASDFSVIVPCKRAAEHGWNDDKAFSCTTLRAAIDAASDPTSK